MGRGFSPALLLLVLGGGLRRLPPLKEFSRYPKYQDAYIRAFDKMLEERKRRGKMQGTWRAGTTGRDIFHWWMEDGVLPGQMEFDDLLLEEDEEW